jgi:hypothetical protein
MKTKIELDFLHNLKGKKVLLYVSSSKTLNHYINLPFDYVILNSKSFPKRNGMQLVSNKIIEMPFDNNMALRELKNAGVKIQCFVGMQDGCCGGGNYECVNSTHFFGRLSPILDDKVLFITTHWDMYQQRVTNVVNSLGFLSTHYKKRELSGGFPIIDKTVHFCEHIKDEEHRVDLPIERVDPQTVEVKFGNIAIKVSHASVWDYEDDFDCLIHPQLASENQYLMDAKERQYRLLDEYKNNPKKILLDANENKWNSIGLVPFLGSRYKLFLDLCEQWDKPYPKNLHFCHMEERDLSEVRERISS